MIGAIVASGLAHGEIVNDLMAEYKWFGVGGTRAGEQRERRPQMRMKTRYSRRSVMNPPSCLRYDLNA